MSTRRSIIPSGDFRSSMSDALEEILIRPLFRQSGVSRMRDNKTSFSSLLLDRGRDTRLINRCGRSEFRLGALIHWLTFLSIFVRCHRVGQPVIKHKQNTLLLAGYVGSHGVKREQDATEWVKRLSAIERHMRESHTL